MQPKTKARLKKTWRIAKWTILWMFVSSLLYIIICRWAMPPITLTQIGDSFGYGLKRDYVSWDEISYNVKLAAIASEDQAFPDHGGFDWDAIEKSLKPKKKNKKTKIIRAYVLPRILQGKQCSLTAIWQVCFFCVCLL